MSTFASITTPAQAGLLAASVLVTSPLVLAESAGAVPAGTSAEGTIQQLEDDGYDVIVSKAGDRPLSLCTVRAVRSGQVHHTAVSPTGDFPRTSHPRQTAYVDLVC